MPLTGAQYMSSLHKQNFDLKLELFHRRQRMAVLEGQLQQMEALRADNAELQEVNEQLLQELEKRDRAVEEAVGIICELEEQVRTLKDLTPEFDSSPNGVEEEDLDLSAQDMVSSLGEEEDDMEILHQESDWRRAASKSRSRQRGSFAEEVGSLPRIRSPPSRNLSFLASRSGTASALRSLYLANESDSQGLRTARRSSNRGSTVTGDSGTYDSGDEAPDVSDSPRLSVLSESSFLSVYGRRRVSAQESQQTDGPDETHVELDERHDLDKSPVEDLEEQAVSLVMEAWSDQHPPREEPDRQSPQKRAREKQLNSISDVLQQRRHPHGQANQGRLIAERDARYSTNPTGPSHFGGTLLHGPVFGGATLPPTPDTLSTVDPEGFNGSSSNLTIRGDSRPETADSSITPVSMRRPRSISDVGLRNRRGFPDALSAKTADLASASLGFGPVSPEQRIVNHYTAIAAAKNPPGNARRDGMEAQEARSSVQHIQPSQHAGHDRATIGLEIPRPAVRPRGTSSTGPRPASARGLSYQGPWTQAALTSTQQSPKKAKGGINSAAERRQAPTSGMVSNGDQRVMKATSTTFTETATVTTTINATSNPSRPSPSRHSSFSLATSLKKAGITSKLFGLGSTSSKSSTTTAPDMATPSGTTSAAATPPPAPPGAGGSTTSAATHAHDAIGRSHSSMNAFVSIEGTSTSGNDNDGGDYSPVDLSSSQLLERGGMSTVEDSKIRDRQRRSMIPRTAETGYGSSSEMMHHYQNPSSSSNNNHKQPAMSSSGRTERPRSGHTRPGPPMSTQSFSAAQQRLVQPSSSSASPSGPSSGSGIISGRGPAGGSSGIERRMSITSSTKEPDRDRNRDRERGRDKEKEKMKEQDGGKEGKEGKAKKRWSLGRSMSALP